MKLNIAQRTEFRAIAANALPPAKPRRRKPQKGAFACVMYLS